MCFASMAYSLVQLVCSETYRLERGRSLPRDSRWTLLVARLDPRKAVPPLKLFVDRIRGRPSLPNLRWGLWGPGCFLHSRSALWERCDEVHGRRPIRPYVFRSDSPCDDIVGPVTSPHWSARYRGPGTVTTTAQATILEPISLRCDDCENSLTSPFEHFRRSPGPRGGEPWKPADTIRWAHGGSSTNANSSAFRALRASRMPHGLMNGSGHETAFVLRTGLRRLRAMTD